MKIRGNEKLTHPAPLVFETLRDRTPELVQLLPNIEHVEVLEERREPPLVHLYNKWHGAQSDVPAVIRPFVKKDLLTWFDRAVWNADELRCTWEIEATIGKDFFSCEGSTTITPGGDDRCEFTLEGEMRIDPDKVPGVPRFLARRIKEPMERFIGKQMQPNLTGIATAVQRYLDGAR